MQVEWTTFNSTIGKGLIKWQPGPFYKMVDGYWEYDSERHAWAIKENLTKAITKLWLETVPGNIKNSPSKVTLQ